MIAVAVPTIRSIARAALAAVRALGTDTSVSKSPEPLLVSVCDIGDENHSTTRDDF
jgi:hypothetical protein